MNTWTVQRVKDELPDVMVRVGGRKAQPVKAVVRGRLNRFATVGFLDSALAVECSWDAVANSLNSGQPLTV